MLSKPGFCFGEWDLENVKVIWSRALDRMGKHAHAHTCATLCFDKSLERLILQARIATGRSCAREKVYIPHVLAKYSFVGHFTGANRLG